MRHCAASRECHASNIRQLTPSLRLNERVLAPVRHLARMAGVSPEEIIEFVLAEVFEGDLVPAVPRRSGPPAAVIPISRGRTWPMNEVDLFALRQSAESTRRRAREARRDAAAACDAAISARDMATRLFGTRGR